MNLNKYPIFFKKSNENEQILPKAFEKNGVMEKIHEKKFIQIKKHSNSEPLLEKLNRFLRLDRRKKSIPKFFKNNENSMLMNHKSSFIENTQNETKTFKEIDNDQTVFITKSFFSSKRENSENSSMSSINSNLCDIEKVKKSFNKRIATRILTDKLAFQKKFIKQLGKDYTPKLVTTNACIN